MGHGRAGVARTRSGSKSKPPPGTAPAGSSPEPKARSFIGTVDVKASTAKMRLVQIAEEILQRLVSDPQAVVSVTVEISAEFPNGVSDSVKRAVSENATLLGFKNKSWEGRFESDLLTLVTRLLAGGWAA